MKKLLALILALVMMLTFVACGAKEEAKDDTTKEPADSTDTPDTPAEPAGLKDVADAPIDILNNIWNKVPEDNRFFVGGGDAENSVMGGAGLVKDPAAFQFPYLIPESEVSKIDNAASIMHGMIVNNFAAIALHYTNKADVEASAKAIEESYTTARWDCGFPERLYIVQIGNETIVAMRGLNDALNVFIPAISEAYSADSIKVLFDAPVALG